MLLGVQRPPAVQSILSTAAAMDRGQGHEVAWLQNCRGCRAHVAASSCLQLTGWGLVQMTLCQMTTAPLQHPRGSTSNRQSPGVHTLHLLTPWQLLPHCFDWLLECQLAAQRSAQQLLQLLDALGGCPVPWHA